MVIFLACNVNMGPATPSVPSHDPSTSLSSILGRQLQTPLINSDFAFLVLLALFGMSNGWLTSLIMMVAPSLEHNKRMRKEWVDTAAVGASFRYVRFNGPEPTLLTRFQLSCRTCFWFYRQLCHPRCRLRLQSFPSMMRRNNA